MSEERRGEKVLRKGTLGRKLGRGHPRVRWRLTDGDALKEENADA